MTKAFPNSTVVISTFQFLPVFQKQEEMGETDVVLYAVIIAKDNRHTFLSIITSLVPGVGGEQAIVLEKTIK